MPQEPENIPRNNKQEVSTQENSKASETVGHKPQYNYQEFWKVQCSMKNTFYALAH